MAKIAQKDLFTKRWRGVPKRRSETLESHAIHIPLVSILRWAMRPEVLWFHIPNGERADENQRKKLGAMGVLAGASDLQFLWRNYSSRDDLDPVNVLFMELKMPGKTRSDVQVDFCAKARNVGAEYVTVHAIDDAIAELRKRGLLRANVKLEPGLPSIR